MAVTSDALTDDERHFFRLPAELRIKIYKHALTEQRPINFDRTVDFAGRWCRNSDERTVTYGSVARVADENLREVNQLRFVNKQMHMETRGLELWVNEMSFKDIQTASYFIQKCSQSNLIHLRVVHLRQGSYYTRQVHARPQLHALVRFCHDHPHATIRSHLSEWSPNSYGTLRYFGQEEAVIRGTQTLVTNLYVDGSRSHLRALKYIRKLQAEQAAQASNDEHNPVEWTTNFKFHPSTEHLDVNLLRDNIGPYHFRRAGFINEVEGAFEGYIRMTRRLIKHGI
ncbi:hypothetical protein FB567DRAFT_183518 [Paraphoma chrysanthemicola]|uniref:Uncharacterized protein n=1 Tax=Paraphoma chrysanthemicola TaxID=798071 RepID=A0A8K0QVJ9_9PLEO|nr:hypothetical protein FB567DRAFT_183518 [Paraphoma chrysanthemicola]